MLSYRHGYHAGNHADVLKHTVLIYCIDYLIRKDKPLLYLDTHAGAGLYDLDSEFSRLNREHAGGVEAVLAAKDLPPLLETYKQQVQQFNAGLEQLRHYPGSPAIAMQRLRPYERLILCEMHSNEAHNLTRFTTGDRRVRVAAEDGYGALSALVPPIERRALVLIDPSYEVKSEYQQLVESVVKAWRKFPQGVYLVWYPLLDGSSGERMAKKIAAAGVRHLHSYELRLAKPAARGMTGSGMLVINPPWGLPEQMQECLPWLARELGAPGEGNCQIKELAGE